MRVLQVVKTSDGAGWAANQCALLVQSGIEVHVALPRAEGRTLPAWRNAGAQIHILDMSLPLRQPARIPATFQALRRLVDEIQPDIIHSHFVTTTLTLRLALGKNHRIPRVYQVAGPLHLEHWHSRNADLATAGDSDYWIGSSRCIVEHYRRASVSDSRLFLSYYGWPVDELATTRTGYLFKRLGLHDDMQLIGNVNYMYPPKRWLGQSVGLKCHEDVIDALATITREIPGSTGVLIGEAVGAPWYEQRLRERAQQLCGDKVVMPGHFSESEVAQSWADFACAIHVPLSENCGGVIEPLCAGVPVVASDVGGIPEVVIEGITGRLVAPRNPQQLANTVDQVLREPAYHRDLARKGGALVRHMFNRRRTADEIAQIYRHIISGDPRPADFDSEAYVRSLSAACKPQLADVLLAQEALVN